MVRLNYSTLQKIVVGTAGFFMLLLVTGCAGVSGLGPNVSGSGGSQPGIPSSGPAVAGSISFTGPVQSVNSSSIVVKLPNGQSLTATIVNGQTDLSDFNGGLPGQNQMVDITATANTDGSFTAVKIKVSDSTDTADQNTVTFDGVVTATVGSDNVLHFRVGTRDFSFTLNANTDLSDFQNNAGSIANNQSIEVKVQFQGTTVTVIKVSVQNNSTDAQNG